MQLRIMVLIGLLIGGLSIASSGRAADFSQIHKGAKVAITREIYGDLECLTPGSVSYSDKGPVLIEPSPDGTRGALTMASGTVEDAKVTGYHPLPEVGMFTRSTRVSLTNSAVIPSNCRIDVIGMGFMGNDYWFLRVEK